MVPPNDVTGLTVTYHVMLVAMGQAHADVAPVVGGTSADGHEQPASTCALLPSRFLFRQSSKHSLFPLPSSD